VIIKNQQLNKLLNKLALIALTRKYDTLYGFAADMVYGKFLSTRPDENPEAHMMIQSLGTA